MNGLKQIRSIAGLSGAALAKRLTVSQPTVFEWEHGKRRIPPEQLKRLSEIFCIPQEYFGEITEDQAKEIEVILSTNQGQNEYELELTENKEALEKLKCSVRRINDISKAKANDFNSFSAYTSHIERCAKMCDKFAEVLELYGASTLLDRCMTALINAETDVKSDDDFISLLVSQIKSEATQNETTAKVFTENAEELF